MNNPNNSEYGYSEDPGNISVTVGNDIRNPVDLSTHTQATFEDNEEQRAHAFETNNAVTMDHRSTELDIFAQYLFSYRTMVQLTNNMKIIIDNQMRLYSNSYETQYRDTTVHHHPPDSQMYQIEWSDKGTSTKRRHCFTIEEKSKLFSHYQTNSFPSRDEYSTIANETNMPRSRILQYFQNKRARKKPQNLKLPLVDKIEIQTQETQN